MLLVPDSMRERCGQASLLAGVTNDLFVVHFGWGEREISRWSQFQLWMIFTRSEKKLN